MRAGPGSTTVTYSPCNGRPLPPPAVTQSKANGPRVGSAVRFCTPHAFFHVAVSSWVAMAVVVAVTAFGFSGLMMLLAAGFRTEGGTQGAGRAVLLVLAMVGGGTVPLVFMPPFLRAASNISPFKWAVMAAEGATWRNWGPDELWMPLAVLAAIGAVGLTAGTALVRRSI